MDQMLGAAQVPPEAMAMLAGMSMRADGSIWSAATGPGASDYMAFAKAALAKDFAELMSAMTGLPGGLDQMMAAMAQAQGIPYLTEVTMTVEGSGQMVGHDETDGADEDEDGGHVHHDRSGGRLAVRDPRRIQDRQVVSAAALWCGVLIGHPQPILHGGRPECPRQQLGAPAVEGRPDRARQHDVAIVHLHVDDRAVPSRSGPQRGVLLHPVRNQLLELVVVQQPVLCTSDGFCSHLLLTLPLAWADPASAQKIHHI
jgi:hypothetical protein